MAENGILDYQGMNQAIYRGATSNIIVDTQSMSIEIGAGNSSHTSNLHIECDHDANVASIQLNSNVVTEFSRSKKLIKYPRVALTSDNQPTGYVASASSNWPGASSDPWQAFDNIWDPDGSGANSWESHSSSFASGTTYIGPRSSTGLNTFDSNNGEYLNIKLPEKIVLQRYKHTTRANRWWEGPYSGFLYGSNDGFTTYDKIHTFSAIELSSEASYIHTVNTTTAYNEYRFHVTQTQASVYLSICLFDLFGTPEYDPEAHGTDVTVKSYPNVPNTDWLEVYYDAKNYTSGVVQDESLNSYVGTLNSVTLDNSAIQSFDIPDGGSISATLTSIPSADFVHSVSVWVKFEGDTLTTSYPYVYFMGTNLSYSGFGLFFAGAARPNQLHVSCWHLDYPINFTFSNDTWHHVTYTYSGGGWSRNSTLNAYVDGIEYGFGTNWSSGTEGTTPTIATSNVPLRLGAVSTGGVFDGKISNFKLYSVALEPSEVQKLYRLGRTGRSMVISDTAVGIGKVPEAQLDVRGNLRVDGDILASVPYYAARQRDVDLGADGARAIIYDQYVYTNYPGSFVRNSNTDGYYQPPRNGMYQVYMECIANSSGNVNIQRRTGTTVNINHCDRHWNFSGTTWESISASALIPITDCTTQNICIYVTGGNVWSYGTFHGSAYFKWFSEIPERRQHHVT